MIEILTVDGNENGSAELCLSTGNYACSDSAEVALGSFGLTALGLS
jgi:hypothetical protein